MDVDTIQGKELDEVVAALHWSYPIPDDFSPSTRWEHAGPIIEKFRIEAYYMNGWKAAIKFRKKTMLPSGFVVESDAYKLYSGETPLIAAMRCFIGSRSKS